MCKNLLKAFVLGSLVLCFLSVTQAKARVVKNCDAFVFLADESSSMHNSGDDTTKMETLKDILAKINQRIPPASYKSALVGFNYDKESVKSFNTKVYYPMGPYDKAQMADAISKLEATVSWTSIGNGLKAADKQLKGQEGRLRIIIFSDGQENSQYPQTPAQVAAQLKKEYGDRLCIYAVQIGDSDQGQAVLDSVVKAAGCGKVVSASDLADEGNLKAFVKEVFGYQVVEKAAPKDSDGDGVIDSLDRCPNTPKGAMVDAHGCWIIGRIYFDFDKIDIKPQYIPTLEKVLKVLKENPQLKLEVIGHTDSRGSHTYNIQLSLERAQAVKNWLVEHGASPDQLFIKGLGESEPIAPNNTPEGRAKNRRVEFKVIR